MQYYWEMQFYTFSKDYWNKEVLMTIKASTKFGCARLFLENYTTTWNNKKYTKEQVKKEWIDNPPEKVYLPSVTKYKINNL